MYCERYFDIPLASPPTDDPPKTLKIGSERLLLHSAAEWAKSNSSRFPTIARDLGLDPDVFGYATWEFLDGSTSSTWPGMASMDEAKSIGWDREVDTWEQGYRAVFDDLKDLGIIPR